MAAKIKFAEPLEEDEIKSLEREARSKRASLFLRMLVLWIAIFLASGLAAGVQSVLVQVLLYFGYHPTTAREFPLLIAGYITGSLGYWLYLCFDGYDAKLANDGLTQRTQRINAEARFWSLLSDHVTSESVLELLRTKAKAIEIAQKTIANLSLLGEPVNHFVEMRNKMEEEFDQLRTFLSARFPGMTDKMQYKTSRYYL
ncbi:MAG: hypothetical protein KBC02_02065 [Candidatus Pacebacteria bacterium]|nr:hypothetical protein [Candidatus Paceibacterota bacterium]